MKVWKSKKGFTLVELLVVLAIVAILIGLAIAGIRIVQQVNRDTQRKAFTRDWQLLLEAYHDKKSRYPQTVNVIADGCSSGETELEARDPAGVVIDSICTRVNFDVIQSPDCDSFPKTDNKETESGDLTMCYEAQSQGYLLFVRLERNATPYNASNEEPT